MYSTGGKFQKVIRIIIDVLNILIGIAVIVFAVMVFTNTTKNMRMFPLIFVLGGTMNFITGIKYFMTDRKVLGIVCEVVAAILMVVSYVTFLALGGK